MFHDSTSSSLNTSRASLSLLALCLIRPIHTEQPDKDKSALGFGSAALKRPSANAGDSALLPRITTPAIEAASGEALELDAAVATDARSVAVWRLRLK